MTVWQASNASTCYDEEARAAAMETRTPEQMPRPIAKRHGSPPSATRCWVMPSPPLAIGCFQRSIVGKLLSPPSTRLSAGTRFS